MIEFKNSENYIDFRMVEEIYKEVFEYLEMIKDDQDASRSLREHIKRVENILNNKSEELRSQKAIFELEELNSQHISSYLKTQIWDVISRLESLNN